MKIHVSERFTNDKACCLHIDADVLHCDIPLTKDEATDLAFVLSNFVQQKEARNYFAHIGHRINGETAP